MEDTHSYLYNFLGTPIPGLPAGEEPSSQITEERKSATIDTVGDHLQQPVETDNGYFAIFDGHAGTFAAEWCGKKLHVILEDLMRRHRNTPVPELLDQTFTSADEQLEKLPLKNSGCTAITAVLRWEDRVPNTQSATGSTAVAPATASAIKKLEAENADTPTQRSTSGSNIDAASQAVNKMHEVASRQRVLYTANVGDARIVLCRNGKALRLSYDHKGSDENEGRRIANAGGLILNNRVNGVLAVTRALGDSYLKDLVTGHPYTTETVIQPEVDEFLILACDGVSFSRAFFFSSFLKSHFASSPASTIVSLVTPKWDFGLTQWLHGSSSGMSVRTKKLSTSSAAMRRRKRRPKSSWTMHSPASLRTIFR